MPHYIEGPTNRDQLWLFERSLDEMLPADAAIRQLSFVMDRLDWSRLELSYAPTGRPAYSPRTMAKALILAYSLGIFSSRRIEEMFYVDLRFKWLANGASPDHTSISRFRKEKGAMLSELFVQSVQMCQRVGLVLLDVLSIDGTKLPANASVKSIWDEKKLNRAREAVEKLLEQAQRVDDDEDASELPEGGPTLEDLKKRQRELEEIARELQESSEAKMVRTDPESRVMKTRCGNRPGFNLQFGVDAESQVILACLVSQGQNDHALLPEVVEQAKDNCGAAPTTVVADKGYDDFQTLSYLESAEQDGLVALAEGAADSARGEGFQKEHFVYDASRDVLVCPEGQHLTYRGDTGIGPRRYRRYVASGCRRCCHWRQCVNGTYPAKRLLISEGEHLRTKMRAHLRTPEGRSRYGLRSVTSEPVFGNVKHNMGFDRFHLRGKSGAQTEASLMGMAHNLWKAVASTLQYLTCRPILRPVAVV